MQILSIYWSGVWHAALSGRPAHLGGHTKAERRAFERRIAIMRLAGRRYANRLA